MCSDAEAVFGLNKIISQQNSQDIINSIFNLFKWPASELIIECKLGATTAWAVEDLIIEFLGWMIDMN